MFQHIIGSMGHWGRLLLIAVAGAVLVGCALKHPTAPVDAASADYK